MQLVPEFFIFAKVSMSGIIEARIKNDYGGIHMAKKAKTVFVCQECGYESPRWLGQCICGAWNSFVEEVVREAPEDDIRRRGSAAKTGEAKLRAPKPVSLPTVKSSESTRIDTGIRELNRVLGGGLVKGSLTLISGEPGIGKSTIIIQAVASISRSLGKVLYVSGEGGTHRPCNHQ